MRIISGLRFDEGLTLKTLAWGTLYGGQFKLSNQLIKKIILHLTQVNYGHFRRGFKNFQDWKRFEKSNILSMFWACVSAYIGVVW